MKTGPGSVRRPWIFEECLILSRTVSLKPVPSKPSEDRCVRVQIKYHPAIPKVTYILPKEVIELSCKLKKNKKNREAEVPSVPDAVTNPVCAPNRSPSLASSKQLKLQNSGLLKGQLKAADCKNMLPGSSKQNPELLKGQLKAQGHKSMQPGSVKQDLELLKGQLRGHKSMLPV
ncbi:hypothetical protein Ancab_036035 [Ancistrocladus abbreviatus]